MIFAVLFDLIPKLVHFNASLRWILHDVMKSNYARRILVGFSFRGRKTTGSKEIRTNPLSSAAEQGNVRLLQARWNSQLLDEFEIFPEGAHDDVVDAVSGAFNELVEHPPLGGDVAPSIF